MGSRLQAFASTAARSVTVIFPEGTFRTTDGHERAVARLSETRPDLAEKAGRKDRE